MNIETNSLSSMMNLLQRKTAHTLAYSHLLSIVYHCLLLPRKSHTHSLYCTLRAWKYSCIATDSISLCAVDDPLYAKYWHLIDRLVQQVVLQQQHGVDPDHAPVPIDVDNLVQK